MNKGIKLSYLIEVFHSMSSTIDKKLETRTIAQFTVELKRKLKMVCSDNPGGHTHVMGKMSSSDSPEMPDDFLYLEYLETYFPKVVGSGQVYISYDPKGNFHSTLDTLEQHFESNPHVYVCLDHITHRKPTTGSATGAVFLIDQFEAAIKQIGHVVLVLSPWNNLRIFRRTAMLFEVHCAVTNDCKFEIALSESDRKELSKAVVNGVVDEMMEGLEWINFERSTSRFHSLNELVKVAVKPFDIANLVVSNAVRDCLIAQSQSKGLPFIAMLLVHQNIHLMLYLRSGGVNNKVPFMLSIVKEEKKSKLALFITNL